MNQYAGQQLTKGSQAEVYAGHFIANHLKAIGGGKTYAQLSAEAQADPSNAKLAATVQTVFQGETSAASCSTHTRSGRSASSPVSRRSPRSLPPL